MDVKQGRMGYRKQSCAEVPGGNMQSNVQLACQVGCSSPSETHSASRATAIHQISKQSPNVGPPLAVLCYTSIPPSRFGVERTGHGLQGGGGAFVWKLSGRVRHGENRGTGTSDRRSEVIKAPPATHPLSRQRGRIRWREGGGESPSIMMWRPSWRVTGGTAPIRRP
jgi:hypothetical protein